MRQCTQAMNAHTASASHPSVIDVFLEVVTRQADDLDPPTADELAAWADVHRAEIERLSGIRASLASLQPRDLAQQADWEAVVGAADDRVAELERRARVLEAGDWPTIIAAFRGTDATPDARFEASLEQLGLARTDCQFAYLPSRAPDAETAAFVARAADACTDFAARRIGGDFEAASATVLDAVLTSLRDGPEALLAEPPEGIDAALETLIEEWHATERDLRAVDPTGAPDARAWEDAVEYGPSRVAVLQERQRALAGGDPEAVREAFATPAGGSLMGFDWSALGLELRSCVGVGA
jgi:hypothetical protein